MENAEFVGRVKDALKKNGVPILKFLDDIGVAHNSLTVWERGNSPRAETVYRIAKYLDTTVEWLLTGKDEMEFAENVRRIAAKVARLPPEYQRFIERQADMYLDALETGITAMSDVPEEVRECAYEIMALPAEWRGSVISALEYARAQSSARGAERTSSAV